MVILKVENILCCPRCAAAKQVRYTGAHGLYRCKACGFAAVRQSFEPPAETKHRWAEAPVPREPLPYGSRRGALPGADEQ